MAKPKEKEQPKKERMLLVRLELPPASHAKLRVIAAKNGVPMSQFVRELVEEKIRKSE